MYVAKSFYNLTPTVNALKVNQDLMRQDMINNQNNIAILSNRQQTHEINVSSSMVDMEKRINDKIGQTRTELSDNISHLRQSMNGQFDALTETNRTILETNKMIYELIKKESSHDH